MSSPGERHARGQILSLCWGSVPGGSLFDLAEAAAGVNIAAISVTPGQVLDALDAGTPAEARRRLDDLGVRVTSIDPLISPVPGTPPPHEVEPRKRALFEASQEDCWRAAEAVGAQTVNFTHFLGAPRSPDAMRDALTHLVGRNSAHGLASTFEFIPGTAVPDLAAAATLTRDIADFTILFDTWHFARSNGRIEDIDALPPCAIGGVQINDWLPSDPGAPYVPMAGRLMPGDGCLPLADILARIEANSSGLEVGIEVFNADLERMDRREAVRTLVCKSQPYLAGQAS